MDSQKIVKSEEQGVLYYNPEKCSGCLLCMVVCSFKHFKIISEDKSHVKVFPNPDKFAYFISAHCAHCEYPACEASCPVNAIRKDEKGIVKINTTQ
ncbi:MAG: 4Fe-4S binding protein, partial [Candidatus Bathyarchaeota archaeon]|nr:4Fe-4S binding protein [Candidatus Bathyarchaeota archaeon]